MNCSRQAPRSMGFSRSPGPPTGHLPNPGIEPGSLALQADSSLSEPAGKPQKLRLGCIKSKALVVVLGHPAPAIPDLIPTQAAHSCAPRRMHTHLHTHARTHAREHWPRTHQAPSCLGLCTSCPLAQNTPPPPIHLGLLYIA